MIYTAETYYSWFGKCCGWWVAAVARLVMAGIVLAAGVRATVLESAGSLCVMVDCRL